MGCGNWARISGGVQGNCPLTPDPSPPAGARGGFSFQLPVWVSFFLAAWREAMRCWVVWR